MTNSITLRDVSTLDLPILYEQQLDPEATAMAAFPSRDHEAFMQHWASIMADKTCLLKTILYEDQIAGNIVSWGHPTEREVGYWLGKEFWGKGIATAALTEFLKIEKTRPLVAHVVRHNVASQRVLLKCGFKVIGLNWAMGANTKEMSEELILQLDAEQV